MQHEGHEGLMFGFLRVHPVLSQVFHDCVLHSAYPMLKRTCRWLLAVNVCFLAALPAAGQDFVFGANQLSAEISQAVPPTSASFSLFNRSSLSDSTVSTIRAGLQQALQSRGWKIGRPDGNEVAITVTL